MTSLPEKMAPHNVEAEEAVLGSLLIDPEAIFRVSPFLRPDDFYIVKNGWVYDAILGLHERRMPADFVTVCDELENRNQLEEIGGPAYISALINAVPTAIHVEAYGHIVERTAVRRRLISVASQIASFAYEEEQPVDEVIDRSESALFSISQRRIARDLVPIKQVLADYYDRIAYLYEHRGEPLGVPTGFIDLDRMLGGMQRSDLLIVAARPGVGKTSMLLAMALAAARKYKQKVAIFSLEMSNEQLVQRLVSSETGIDSQRLRLGDLKEDEWPKFVEAAGRLSDTLVFIDDTPGLTAMQLRTKARRIHAEYGLDLIMVDYLQLMSGDFRSENRVQEISYISRSLKGLARELNVPLIAASQLSRAVEQRHDKRPILSDLRESGCLAGDTLIQMANGQRVPIRTLAQNSDSFQVLALNQETWHVELVTARKAWKTGTQPVQRLTTQLGHQIRATGNHKFRTVMDWKRLDELRIGDYIALPRSWRQLNISQPTMIETEVALLGHLIGDGCTLPRHSIQYTTQVRELAELVVELTQSLFGDTVAPRISRERNWWQVHLSASEHLTHQRRNPIAQWLDDLGVWALRSYEKRVPKRVFVQPNHIIQRFLKHLWATDGALGVFGRKNPRAWAYYATSSEQLARDVQYLLRRLGIMARIHSIPQGGKGRDQWHVTIFGKPDVMAFAEKVGVVGPKQDRLDAIRDFYCQRAHNTNRDIIPRTAWYDIIEPARKAAGMSQRTFQAALGISYCGSTLFKSNLSRERALQVSQVVQDPLLEHLALSDVYWDRITAIEPAGEEDVYDLEVPGHHNFVANDIIVHNSIEQDADVVIFIYRDELYNPDTELKNIADVIIAKHRHGPTGSIQLFFRKHLAQFVDAEVYHRNIEF
jgi:replicative DNA helicase